MWVNLLDGSIRSEIRHAAQGRYGLRSKLINAVIVYANVAIQAQIAQDLIANKLSFVSVFWENLLLARATGVAMRIVTNDIDPKDYNCSTLNCFRAKVDRSVATSLTSRLGGRVIKAV